MLNERILFIPRLGVLVLILFFTSGCSYFDFEKDLRICGEVYVVAEQMPLLIGGMAELQQNVEYPQEAREQGIEGRVTVQFIVNKLGNPTEAQVIRSIGAGADEEALRVIKEAKFEPGRHKGKRVCVQYALSINFRLQN